MPWVDHHEVSLSTFENDKNPQEQSQENVRLALLPKCASYLHVKLQSTVDAGDHLVTICELIGTGVWDSEEQTIKQQPADAEPAAPMDHQNVLYTGLLRQEGII